MSKKPRFPPNPRLLEIVMFPDVQLLDAAGPITAFEIAERFVRGAYELRFSASSAGVVTASSGVAMAAAALSPRTRTDTLIVVGGGGTREAMSDAVMLKAL